MIVLAIVAVIVGFGGMVASSRRAVGAATELVGMTHLPPFVIGMTVLAIGTDLPEIANSLVSSWSDHGDVSVGNAVGSSATQLTLVLGLLPILVGALAVTSRGIPITGWLTVAGIGLVVVLAGDGTVGRTDAAVLIGVWVAGSGLIWWRAREPVQLSLPDEPTPRGRLVLITLGAFAVLAIAAVIALWGVVELADRLAIPEFVVSFFVGSIGTSLPELVFDVTAIRRGEPDLAIGDIFGSSFVDASLAVGIGPIFFPVAVSSDEIRVAGIATMVIVAVVTLLMTRIDRHDWRTGAILLALYGALFFFVR